MNRAIYIHAGGGYDRFQKELLWAEKAGFRAVGIEVGRIGMDEGGYDVIRRCRALLDEKGMLCTQTHLDCYDPLLCSTVVKADIEESIRYWLSTGRKFEGDPYCVVGEDLAIQPSTNERCQVL